jgi:hypothetical protein
MGVSKRRAETVLSRKRTRQVLIGVINVKERMTPFGGEKQAWQK